MKVNRQWREIVKDQKGIEKNKYAPTGAFFATEKPHKKSPAAQKGINIQAHKNDSI